MRNTYRTILKHFFHTRLITLRNSTNYTQVELSEKLQMDERSFSYLIHGKTSCSAVTLVLFLLYLCPDPNEFLLSLKEEFEKAKNNAA